MEETYFGCGCTITQELGHLPNIVYCPMHIAAPDLLTACEFWLGAVQNSLGLRLALTSLPESAGPALVEMLNEAIAKTKGE